jgi:predicted ABC-type ATPase
MSAKRLRIFAEPNGSGKTTIINELKTKITFGVYVNADDIEKALNLTGEIDLTSYQIKITTAQIQSFIREEGFAKVKLEDDNLWKYLSVADNHIIVSDNKYINSYLAADIAECIRQYLLAAQISFSFETVMSHKDKLRFMEKTKQEGYKLYLYYIATEAPEININRVRIRIEQQGHAVNETKITDRYYRIEAYKI